MFCHSACLLPKAIHAIHAILTNPQTRDDENVFLQNPFQLHSDSHRTFTTFAIFVSLVGLVAISSLAIVGTCNSEWFSYGSLTAIGFGTVSVLVLTNRRMCTSFKEDGQGGRETKPSTSWSKTALAILDIAAVGALIALIVFTKQGDVSLQVSAPIILGFSLFSLVFNGNSVLPCYRAISSPAKEPPVSLPD